jgi:hypothetical protein
LLQEYVSATINDWSLHSDKVQLLTYQLEKDKSLVKLLNVAVNVDGTYELPVEGSDAEDEAAQAAAAGDGDGSKFKRAKHGNVT